MTHVKAPREIFSIIKRTSGCVQHDRIRLYSNTAFWNIKGGGGGNMYKQFGKMEDDSVHS